MFSRILHLIIRMCHICHGAADTIMSQKSTSFWLSILSAIEVLIQGKSGLTPGLSKAKRINNARVQYKTTYQFAEIYSQTD